MPSQHSDIYSPGFLTWGPGERLPTPGFLPWGDGPPFLVTRRWKLPTAKLPLSSLTSRSVYSRGHSAENVFLAASSGTRDTVRRTLGSPPAQSSQGTTTP